MLKNFREYVGSRGTSSVSTIKDPNFASLSLLGLFTFAALLSHPAFCDEFLSAFSGHCWHSAFSSMFLSTFLLISWVVFSLPLPKPAALHILTAFSGSVNSFQVAASSSNRLPHACPLVTNPDLPVDLHAGLQPQSRLWEQAGFTPQATVLSQPCALQVALALPLWLSAFPL